MLKKLHQLNPLRKINNALTPSKDAKNKCGVASNVTNTENKQGREAPKSAIGSKKRRKEGKLLEIFFRCLFAASWLVAVKKAVCFDRLIE